MEPFLSLNHISKTFHATRALDDIALAFMPGEVHCLAGQNGCGKSTLIKIISGVYRPDEGAEIRLGGRQYSRLSPAQSVASGIQVIYQDLSLFANLSVWENIAINHYHHGLLVNKKRLRQVAERAMASIHVSLPLEARVGELSIARCQLVAICRALAQDARLIIMDEPTASLTHQEVEGLLHIVRQLREKGICVVFVSHRLEEVMAVSDRISVLKDGQLVGTWPAAEITTRRLGFLMTGREFDYQVRELWQSRQSTPVLEVRKLSRAGEYQEVSLRVEAGEVVSIVGLLGAGRTELCLSLFGMTRPDSGEILINGQPVALRSNRDAIRHGVGYVSEDRMSRGLIMTQSIENNIISTVFGKVTGPGGLISRARSGELVARLVTALSIKTGDVQLPVNTLSGGNAQRVSIARWLAITPKLLILDSPTVGVDIANKAGIYHIISELASHGIAVLMICDEIDEAWYQSHRILVMQQGRITHSFLPDTSTREQIAEVVSG
ncbi:sugar ABC transporter ATP-binding protein [Shimwellia blattae]|uniref:Ribose import ATP-binding protein rbsA 2 n=1 Tax=Shimwellia blattae (strain ATCC 29907 / DSM 4481 / JCM 1650 / NBRC 105725 / CDC 9005-74) TaxID=630626 RepID=I2BD64_SHIBC|nr:sugar ABC transporter ATP-binding protein [Shimwellia blattae]AFJ48468.1 ribose import ATP-binding protein rbsA 2 [Shimwellia blattae DSM 4481 = NBRC 105725]GAB82543.1 putative ABC transporter ATP-binding protein [Shimwellia blattae DSM 4481 = NBRC 105725]VDY65962.1 Ribose import ATP-binding protein RbsA [Shimwellia blattae]VEC26445.1 Ribose import ATP-binding protein RbsA [Shimwellia blattae]